MKVFTFEASMRGWRSVLHNNCTTTQHMQFAVILYIKHVIQIRTAFDGFLFFKFKYEIQILFMIILLFYVLLFNVWADRFLFWLGNPLLRKKIILTLDMKIFLKYLWINQTKTWFINKLIILFIRTPFLLLNSPMILTCLDIKNINKFFLVSIFLTIWNLNRYNCCSDTWHWKEF